MARPSSRAIGGEDAGFVGVEVDGHEPGYDGLA